MPAERAVDVSRVWNAVQDLVAELRVRTPDCTGEVSQVAAFFLLAVRPPGSFVTDEEVQATLEELFEASEITSHGITLVALDLPGGVVYSVHRAD